MDQRDLLRMAIDCLEQLQIPYLVCGSVASGGYGEPRMTMFGRSYNLNGGGKSDCSARSMASAPARKTSFSAK